jgi:cytochrome b6-f complex iron-sulfur subunit
MTASAEAKQGITNPSRRETLNYLFGASIALALAGSCGGMLWFTQRQLDYGAESGRYLVNLETLPVDDGRPVRMDEAHVWLAIVEGGLVAFTALCPKETCRVRWSVYNWRFECPCCGSKYQLDGTYIEGPSRRGMDRLPLHATSSLGWWSTPADVAPISIEGVR